MLGLLDRSYIKKNRYGVPNPEHPRHEISKRPIEHRGNFGVEWICVFPAIVYDNRFLFDRVCPKTCGGVAYRIPSDTITLNPFEIAEVFRNYCEDAKNEALRILDEGKVLHTLGMSLGSPIAFKLANELPARSLTAITTGADLPLCIQNSVAARKFFEETANQQQNNRLFSHEDFTRALAEFSPVNNSDHLPAEIEIHLAGFDKMIPSQQGVLLVNYLRERGYAPRVTDRFFLDHISTIFLYNNRH